MLKYLHTEKYKKSWVSNKKIKSAAYVIHLLAFISYSTLNQLHHERCPSCNGYRCRKGTQRHEFKSWTRLIAFHIALIPLGKVWIQYSPSSYGLIVGQTGFFSLGEATSLGEGKLWIQTRLKIDFVSDPARAEGLVNMVGFFFFFFFF